MATYERRKGFWWVKVRRAGFPAQTRSFNTKPLAQAWARDIGFVDASHPALRRMWDKRQRGYKAMGYRIAADGLFD